MDKWLLLLFKYQGIEVGGIDLGFFIKAFLRSKIGHGVNFFAGGTSRVLESYKGYFRKRG